MATMDRKMGIALGITGLGLYALTQSAVASAQEGKRIRLKLQHLNELIYKNAATWKLPPDLVRATIWIESHGKVDVAPVYERTIEDYSYGVMMVTMGTAKEMGFTGTPEELQKPETNIHYGCKYLRKQYLRYKGSIPDTAAAYNAGGAYKRGGKYINQHHVNKVVSAYTSLLKYEKSKSRNG